MQTVTVNGATTTFTYDGDGKLVKKTVGITTTYYVNGGYEKTGNVVTKYYYAGSQRAAMRVCTGTNGSCGTNGATSTLSYLHGDHLGSASLSTSITGSVVSEMRYYPYGETRSGAIATDRRYTGQRQEIGLGLYDYNARYYDPYLNRFLSPDSIVPSPANPQTLNRYAYTRNNPIRYNDPSGHDVGCPGMDASACGWGSAYRFSGPASSSLRVDVEKDFGVAISAEFTSKEKRWINEGFGHYASFLGGEDKFEQVIVKEGGLRRIELDRGGTIGEADPKGTLTLQDFSFDFNGSPAYMLDETHDQEVAFTKLLWHETTHYLQYSRPGAIDEYVKQTPEQNWYRQETGTWHSSAPGSQRSESYERMSDAFSGTLYNHVYSSRFGMTSGLALPVAYRPWLLNQIEER